MHSIIAHTHALSLAVCGFCGLLGFDLLCCRLASNWRTCCEDDSQQARASLLVVCDKWVRMCVPLLFLHEYTRRDVYQHTHMLHMCLCVRGFCLTGGGSRSFVRCMYAYIVSFKAPRLARIILIFIYIHTHKRTDIEHMCLA